MSNSELPAKTIEALLTSLATEYATEKLVEYIVVGDLPVEEKEICGEWPSNRIDGIRANYFSLFKKLYLLSNTDDDDTPEFKAALHVVDSFVSACENENQKDVSRLGALIFDECLKKQRPDYLAQQTMIDSVYSKVSFPSMSDEEREQNKAEMKASFVLKQIISTFRRTKAETELKYTLKYSTLEENIETIIYATILITERLLQEQNIDYEVLTGMWQCGGFFCDIWFASTLVDDPDIEKSQTVREQVIAISEAWPDYAQNMVPILDHAAIIQNRLFSNRWHNPKKDCLHESFKIWNIYAAAALRLGEMFFKYRNHLPLDSEEFIKLKALAEKSKPLIITEGKTDWMHIKNAYRHFKRNGRYPNMSLTFFENTENMGDESMLRMCKEYAKISQDRPVIFIADADNAKIIREMSGAEDQFKIWGNNVFSFCLPTPPHRKKYEKISVEFYYTDEEIGTPDPNSNRRLLFSNQVNEIIEKNKTTNKAQSFFRFCEPKMDDEYMKYIYDDKCDLIEDKQGNKVAHSKYTFARKIYNGEPGFDNFDLSNFALIFDVIETILSSDVSHEEKNTQ